MGKAKNGTRQFAALAITALVFVVCELSFTSAQSQTANSTQDQTATSIQGQTTDRSKLIPPQVSAPPPEEGEGDEAETIEKRIRRYRQRHGERSPELRLKFAREEYERLEAEKANRIFQPSVDPIWVSLGPTNGAGRMTAIAPHPAAVGTVYVGADGGGVWKTTNGGASWVTLTDSINNLAVGALALAPSSPNIIYLGTGSEHTDGIGMLKSTDAGITWSFPASIVASRFFRISVHPTNPQDLFAAANDAGFRSTDGGATWTEVITTPNVTDVVRDPTNPLILYAAVLACTSSCDVRVFKSTNGGSTWTDRSVGLPTTTPPNQSVSSMAIAISPTNPLVLYTSFAMTEGDTVSHIFKTTNGANSWADLTSLSGDPTFNHYMSFQAFHDNTIVVSPTDSNVVIAGGVFYVRSTNGGGTWSNPSFTGNNVHVDAADLRYQGSTLYIANDGGIWSTPDNGETATARNNGLVTREYYSMYHDDVNRNRIFAGSQDNGTEKRPDIGSTAWTPVFSGDGFDCAVNPDVPSIAYWSYQGGILFRTKDAANVNDATYSGAIEPYYPPGEPTPFGTLLTIDTNKPSTLYTATYRVWRTTDGGDSWKPLPTTTTDGSLWSSTSGPDIASVAVSRTNSSFLLVSKFHQDLGWVVFRSTNGGTSWTRSAEALPFINNLEIDPFNSNIAYASLSDFFTGHSVYMTTDSGKTWAPRETGIPVSALAVRVNPTDSNILYCGTIAGVYWSTNQGLTWARYGVGLPSVSVDDLRILGDGSILRAATYGRGVWEIQFATGNTPPNASISSPATTLRVIKGTSINFQGSISDPNGGDVATGIWTFTDTGETVPVGSGTSNVSHTFSRAGKFIVGLAARDSHAARGAASVVIKVFEPFDSCAASMIIPGNGPFPFSITTNEEAASAEASDPVSCISATSSLWFEFTPAVTGNYQFSIDHRIFNISTGISIWTGPRCGPYSAVPNGCQSDQVTVFAQAGVTLRIMVDGLSPDFGRTFTLTVSPTPVSCIYSLSSTTQSFTFKGGSGSIDIAAPSGCGWSASSNNSFIIIILSGGTGNGTVNYFVEANTGPARTGSITVAGQTFVVVQGGKLKPFDFDADSKSDLSVWRPSTGVWFIKNSSSGGTSIIGWGVNGDQIVPGDYDGDSKADAAVWRPSTGVWFILNSSNGSMTSTGWGASTDIPVPGDYDGDGKTDIAVWRPSSGTWFIINSSNGLASTVVWGVNGDAPATGDYDGDGTSDIAVWRPSTGVWFIINSSNGSTSIVGWGVSGDKVVAGDYDGDGKTDVAVWRPSTGVWFVKKSSDGSTATTGWGVSTDVAVPGDFDGDGKTDVAVWRPSSGTWIVINSSSGSTTLVAWGVSGDVPMPSAFVRP